MLTVFLFVITLITIKLTCAVLKEGDLCTINDQLQGQCALLQNCEQISKILFSGQVSNHISCGYNNEAHQEIVCCPNSKLGPPLPLEPKEPVTLTPIPVTENLIKTFDAINDDDETKLIFSRISEKKCKEYQLPIAEKWSNRNFNDEIIVKYNVKCPHITEPYIVGGTKARPFEFPHMALIGSTKNSVDNPWHCGGTLISDEYVLTAAHCYNNFGIIADKIRLGELDYKLENDNADPQDYKIINVTLHPNFTSDSAYNDIALFKLENKVNFTAYIRPACLSTNLNDYKQIKSIASGWGGTRKIYGDQLSSYLKKATLEKFDYQECNTFYKSLQSRLEKLKNNILNESQICAGSRITGDDTCHGDSGGPLQIYHSDKKNYDCMYSIIGITSLGYYCGVNVPGIYTNVYNYLDWIEGIVWPDDKL